MPVATVAAVAAVAGDESGDDIVVAQANILKSPISIIYIVNILGH
jgi:hypothetical protein